MLLEKSRLSFIKQFPNFTKEIEKRQKKISSFIFNNLFYRIIFISYLPKETIISAYLKGIILNNIYNTIKSI